MKVILRQDIPGLGIMGAVVKVKDGYARNYLIPRELAYYATDAAIKRIEVEKKKFAKQIAEMKVQAEALAEKFTDEQVTLAMKVGEEGKLYGSVNQMMIGEELKIKGYDIDRRNIIIEEPIKSLGVFSVKIKLHPEVIVPLKVWVISEDE